MPDPFISEQDVVYFLGRGDATDPGLTIAVDSACDIVRTEAGQAFNEVSSDDITLDGMGTDALLLPEAPVTAIHAVTVAGTAVTDYVLRDDGCLIRVNDSTTTTIGVAKWPEGRQNIDVTYTHGYATGQVPRDVKMVALMIASRLIVQGPLKQETIGQTSATYAIAATDLTDGERRILRKHRVAR